MLVGKQKLYLIFESKLKRAQVEVRPADRVGCQVHRLQRRRGRPGRVHGPQSCWRAIRTASSRAWRSPVTPSAPRQGYVYVRAEYPLAVERLGRRDRPGAREWACWAGNLRHGFRLRPGDPHGRRGVRLRRGDRADRSIEGNRGEPRPRPPFPARRVCGASRRC